MRVRHQAAFTEQLESRVLLSGRQEYLDGLIRQADAELRFGYSAERARTLELLRTLSTRDTGAVYQKQGIVLPDGGIAPQTVQSTPLIHLNTFRADTRFAAIDGSGFSTVIIDTGIDLNHGFFGPDSDSNGTADRIVYSYDFSGSNDADASDQDGHGSNVASIAASSDSTYRGMAPVAGIIALKVFPDVGGGAQVTDIQEALQWVVANAITRNIASVNMSMGIGNYAYSDFSGVFADEFAALANLNVIVSVSSGNGWDGSPGVSDPANSYDVISVGAVYDSNAGGFNYGGGMQVFTTAADAITPFTQRHPTLLDIFAPGAPITGANRSGGTVTMHGTSQAAPHIAGIAVLAQQLAVQELGRRLTTDEFRALLKSSGTAIVDGDDENDTVEHTGLTFRRVDVLALGNAIMDLRPVSISGTVYQDSNGNGSNDSEPALAGWTVYLDDNLNGTPDVAASAHSSTDVAKSIRDQNVTRSLLSVSGRSGPITDVNITLSISHNANSQLGVFLLSPWGDRIKLATGLTGRHLTGTVLDDEAATVITSGVAPYSGSFRPQSSMAGLDGFSANGDWYLELNDTTAGSSGTLNSWSLTIATAERVSVSAANGVYGFTGLRAGIHVLREIVQSGWTQTQPAAGYYALDVVPDSVLTGFAFGNRAADAIAPTVLSTMINDGLAQRSRIKQISVQFSEPVVIGSAFALLNRRTAAAVPGVSITWAVDTVDARLYHLSFSGTSTEAESLPDGLFSLKVIAAGISDTSGNLMAADYTLQFHRLFGDIDGDRDVDRADQAAFKNALNRPGNYAWYMDFDGEGDVDSLDLQQLKIRANRALL